MLSIDFLFKIYVGFYSDVRRSGNILTELCLFLLQLSILQFLNSAAFVDRGMGKIVQYEDISKETFEDAIKFALDPNTQENAKKVSYSYKNRPKPVLETAVWWVEHVAATGGAPLTNCHSTFMTWYEYHLIDVYAVVVSGLVIFVASWVWMIKRICGKSKQSSKVKAH